MKKDSRVYLAQILERIDRILEYKVIPSLDDLERQISGDEELDGG